MSNAHEKLIKKIPTLNKDEINSLQLLNIYTDAIYINSNNIIDLTDFSSDIKYDKFHFALPSNFKKNIFYYNESLKHNNYQEVLGFHYLINSSYDRYLKYYTLDIDCEKSSDLNLEFFVLEYEEDNIINIIRIDEEHKDFQVQDNTEYFKVYIKFDGEGLIYNLSIDVFENKRHIISTNKINFKEDKLYAPANEIVIYEESGETRINLIKSDKKYFYISYDETNNKFTIKPESDIFNEISFNNQVLSDLELTKDDTVEVIPMLVEYNPDTKTNIKNLSITNQQILNFKSDTNSLRFVMRVSGYGEITLKSLSIYELEPAPEIKRIDFTNRQDVISLLGPQMELGDFKVACIMDEFTYNSFNPEVNLHMLSINKWKSEILFLQPDLIFIESAWLGNNGQWHKKVAYFDEEQHSEIRALISFSQSLKIPVIFWNKEDPVHYDRFIETAKLCDYVFTTDSGRVEQYKHDCGHSNVAALPFAAQPKNHNPIKIQKKRDSRVSFAGSYYRHHEERSRDMNILLEASKDTGLVIYDRNYEKTKKGKMPNHTFPDEFQEYIKGTLPFNLIDKSYKGYKYMINVNTVKRSETMFSRRVFEGLISGTPIISTYSLGMRKMFGDIIQSSNKIENLKSHLNMLNSDKILYSKFVVKGVREVLKNHTYQHRMKQILNTVGYKVKSEEKKVYFVALINHSDQIDSYYNMFLKQSVSNKKLVIIHKNINDYEEFYNNFNNEEIIGIDYNALLKYINLRQLLGEGYLFILNENHHYGEHYALDLILAYDYSEADIIGKSMYYTSHENDLKAVNKNQDFIFTSSIKIDRSVIAISVFDKFSIDSTLEYLEGISPLSELSNYGVQLFSSDALNFVENGKEKEISGKLEV